MGKAHLVRLRFYFGLLTLLLTLLMVGCQPDSADIPLNAVGYDTIANSFSLASVAPPAATQPDKPPLASVYRLIHIDPLELPLSEIVMGGSDTVSPISQMVADAFNDDGYIGSFNIEASSTGNGMKLLCAGGAIDIVNSSRSMKESEEEICTENGIVPMVFKVAYDPFVFIVNNKNFWIESIESEQIIRLFRNTSWSNFNDSYPDRPINFYLPRVGGGALSAMNEFVYDDPDAEQTADIATAQYYPFNLELTRDLAADPNGVGFASYGKLQQFNELNVRIVPIDNMDPIRSSNKYPVRRSLYIVTSSKILAEKPEVATFIAYYFNLVERAALEIGFAPLAVGNANAERLKYMQMLQSLGELPEITSLIELDRGLE